MEEKTVPHFEPLRRGAPEEKGQKTRECIWLTLLRVLPANAQDFGIQTAHHRARHHHHFYNASYDTVDEDQMARIKILLPLKESSLLSLAKPSPHDHFNSLGALSGTSSYLALVSW
ncbi:hypothetical protein B9Z65_4372 [Elsinoe australis]|uniref:Uncharacterized protein n=1 Tax=Elsinoe australis TaxID=40998 RepID=A0A2P7Z2M8_9PEZI|nr:hypothetical protein B9Z65_4372 [Elsinoe australis]